MKETMKLTDAKVRRLKPQLAAYDVSDGQGLALRVKSSGVRTWVYQYRSADKARRMILGDFPGVDVRAARVAAVNIREAVRKGGDPAGDRAASRAAKAGEGTLAGLLDAFVEDQSPEWRPSTRSSWTRFVGVLKASRLGSMAPASITAADVSALIESRRKGTKDKKPAPVSAQRLYEVLRRALAWGVHKERLEVSPCDRIKTFAKKRNGRSKPTPFSDEQLSKVLTELDGARGLLFKLAAFTGVREHEVRAARWEEIDLDAKLWRIPSLDRKGGEPHVVPLSPGAVALLEAISRDVPLTGDPDPWVFPSPTSGCEVCERAGHLGKMPSRMAKRLKEDAGIEGRGLVHRLRHTMKTWMSEQGVPAETSERVLGHALPGVLGVYDHGAQLDQRRKALEAWGQHVEGLTDRGCTGHPIP